MSTREKILFAKNFPRKRFPLSRVAMDQKYILDCQQKEFGQVITERNRIHNTSIVTFRFDDIKPQVLPAELKRTHRAITMSALEDRRKSSAKQGFMPTLKSGITRSSLGGIKIRIKADRNSQVCAQEEENRFSPLKIMGKMTNLKLVNQDTIPVKMASTRSSISYRLRRTSCQQREAEEPSFSDVRMVETASIIEHLRKPALRKDYFVFGMSDKIETPENKIQLFRDLLWKLNYANSMYIVTPPAMQAYYRAYIGPGNNCSMLKGILRRRSWWNIVDKPEEANFVWTQLKNNSFLEAQQPSKQPYELEKIYSDSVREKMEGQGRDCTADQFSKIFNEYDLAIWREHCVRHPKSEQKMTQMTYIKRVGMLNRKKMRKVENAYKLKLHNHLQQNYYIGNKKALFYNMKRYCDLLSRDVFQIVPLTFHISKGMDDPIFSAFLVEYGKIEERKRGERDLRNVWIMKPGENTNRGNGISVCAGLDDIRCRLKSKEKNGDGSLRSFILQKYIQKPLLYKGRKFDIRHYLLITCFNGVFKGYWYQEGYIRTASSEFSLRNAKDLYIHLTNDAIQKNGTNYGKYESGNKLSYEEIQRYIHRISKKGKRDPVSFSTHILPKMKEIAKDAIKASYAILDRNRKEHNFQLLGLDFMIDDQYRPFLIQANTNPCLELSCPLLSRLIPEMIENTIRLSVDPLFPPPENLIVSKKSFFSSDNPLSENKMQLIFDEVMEGAALRSLYEGKEEVDPILGRVEEDQQEFQNDGQDMWEQREQDAE